VTSTALSAGTPLARHTEQRIYPNGQRKRRVLLHCLGLYYKTSGWGDMIILGQRKLLVIHPDTTSGSLITGRPGGVVLSISTINKAVERNPTTSLSVSSLNILSQKPILLIIAITTSGCHDHKTLPGFNSSLGDKS
jgi:hypothetical protein